MSRTSLLILSVVVTMELLIPMASSFSPYSCSINDVGFSVLNSLETTDNVFLSPVNIYIALSMIHLGARGQAQRELEKVLRLRYPGFAIPDLHMNSKYLKYPGGNNDYNLTMANGIFVQRGYKIKPSLIRNLMTFYHAEAHELDFAKDGQGAKNQINVWASEKTRNTISNIIEKPMDPTTKISIINAMYFKGYWQTQFDPRNTVTGLFYETESNYYEANLMQMTNAEFKFYKDPISGYKFLEMPYEGNDIIMLLALPKNTEGLPSLKMSNKILMMVQKNLVKTRLSKVVIPKFRMEYGTELKPILKSMGINDLFSIDADLRGISDLSYKSLFVSSVIHKVVVEVNEEGGKAASTLANVLIRPRVARPDFVANRPFLFYVLDRRLDVLLFAGRLVKA